MSKHIETLLASAGLSPEMVKEVLELPEDKQPEFKPDSYLEAIRTSQETVIKNDPKFWEALDENNVNETLRKKIEAQQYGRASNIARQNVIKALGFKEDDFNDLPDEGRRNFEIFMAKAAEKYASSKASDKQMQAELVEARKKYEELEAALPGREDKIKQEYDAKFNEKVVDLAILTELGSIEGLKVPANYLLPLLSAKIKAEYGLEVDGFKVNPKQKANPKLDILEGSKALGLKDLLVKHLKADNLIGEAPPANNGNSGSVQVDVDPDGKGKLGISSHVMAKIAKNMEAEPTN